MPRSSLTSCALVTNEISASTLGIEAPMSTTKGACFTPRSFMLRLVALRRSTIARCTCVAKSRDSSSLLCSAMALTKSGSAAIDWPDEAFSRAATAAAVLVVAKFKKYVRSEEHTSELQSQSNLVCRLLLEKKKKKQ